MNQLGTKIAKARRDAGLTQMEFADRLFVTRQTVSRWESGAASPDVETVVKIAEILGVSCDYLLRDDAPTPKEPRPASIAAAGSAISRLLQSAQGRQVKLTFFDDEADVDLFNAVCTIEEFRGNWMRVVADTKKGRIEKLIPVSSVLSIEFVDNAKEA